MIELLYIAELAFIFWMIVKIIRRDAFFVPLPHGTIRQMLKMAKVRKTDVLYDLGAGDGRVLVIAAKEFGCKAIGVERNKLLCWLARKNLKWQGVHAKIVCGDFFKQDISDATVVAVYLSGRVNEKLKGKLKRLKKGTRVVSASHVFKGWHEIAKVRTGHFYCYLYKV